MISLLNFVSFLFCLVSSRECRRGGRRSVTCVSPLSHPACSLLWDTPPSLLSRKVTKHITDTVSDTYHLNSFIVWKL